MDFILKVDYLNYFTETPSNIYKYIIILYLYSQTLHLYRTNCPIRFLSIRYMDPILYLIALDINLFLICSFNFPMSTPSCKY